MSATIMLIAINGLAGFALGLLGRSRVAIFALFGTMIFSATVLWAIVESQVVWKTIICMFAGQAAFLLASAVVFFSSTQSSSSAVAPAQGAKARGVKRWAKKQASKVR
ncbi:MAG: hypothetical protein JWR89_5115 [Tardiphaga sp.]|uniref:hypothetical protein n=1 Tax=Tardiphaga sp. TaxID=1926292 RepID=UPI0026197719|nr:hypothetical protein [Tardiphaga sp.]MDB5505213.1 hypothetical protein [Tardiphaga sp.]